MLSDVYDAHISRVYLSKGKCQGNNPCCSHHPLYHSAAYHTIFSMSLLFEGWLQLYKGRPYKASPTMNSADLFVYKSCASLGPLSTSDFVTAEVQLSPSGSSVEQKVLHVHGCFCVITHVDGSIILQINIQHFVIMENMNPLDRNVPRGLCSSVTVTGGKGA